MKNELEFQYQALKAFVEDLARQVGELGPEPYDWNTAQTYLFVVGLHDDLIANGFLPLESEGE